MDIAFDARVQVPDEVLMRQIEGEAVILNLTSEQYFGLDEVGTHMWEVLTSAPTIGAAYEALLAEYAVDPETLRADLVRLVGELAGQGLLKVAPPDTIQP